jgi:hypothetical protein
MCRGWSWGRTMRHPGLEEQEERVGSVNVDPQKLCLRLTRKQEQQARFVMLNCYSYVARARFICL